MGCLKKNCRKFKVKLSFLFGFIVSVLCSNGYLFLLYTFAIILHELSHLIVAKKRGYMLSRFELSILGACLDLESEDFFGMDELVIALAGPIMSLLIFILCCCSWWLFPVLYIYTYDFAIVNLFIFIINILPLYSLDGGRVIVCLVSRYKNRKMGVKIVKTMGIIVSFLLFFAFLLSIFISFNFSLGLFSVFLFLSSIDNSSGFFNKISVKDKFKKLQKQNSLYVKTYVISNKSRLIDMFRKLSYSTFSCFIVVDSNYNCFSINEIELLELMQKCSAGSVIDDVVRL